MKRFLCNIILFLFVALVGYGLLVSLLGGTGLLRNVNFRLGNYGHLASRVQEAADTYPVLLDNQIADHSSQDTHNVDVLFLGSSHAYRTFDTRFYDSCGLKTFNLGSSNQTPLQTYVLLQRYLDGLNPKMVVFEVHPDILTNDGVEGAVDMLSNVPVTCAMTRMAWTMHNAKVFNTWIYAVAHRRKIKNFVEDSIVDGFAYVKGGFVETDDVPFQPVAQPPMEIKLDARQMNALRDCLSLLRQRNIPYMLVEVQGSKVLRDSYTNHADFEAAMRQLGDYHYTVLPMSDSLHFYDEDHLNKAGIKMFNEYFIGKLSKSDQ